MKKALLLLFATLFATSVWGQTQITISGTTLQANIKGAGVNMGQNLPYSSNQFMKNLINENPGFNPTTYRSIIYCGSGTNSSLCVDTEGQSFQSGFWPYGSSAVVLTGAAAGCVTGVGTVSGSDFPLTIACSGIASGDYIFVTKTITSANAGSSWLPAYGWTTTAGSGSPTFTISTDVPPPANGDTYTQSLDVTTPTSSDIGYVTAQADYFYNTVTSSNQSAIALSGSYTLTYWAKSKSGSSPNVVVSFGRTNNSPCVSACFLNFTTDTITGTWTQYSHTFTANETTVNNNALQLNMAFTGPQEILIDNVAVTEATTSGNPTPFRNAVVTTLKNLKPGSLRMWNHQSLTDTIPNMLAGQFARSPNNFLTYVTGIGYSDFVVYGIPDMLQLCQAVGSECWISIPVTSTNAEVSELVDYLSDATGTTTGGALRVAQGFSTPWTSVSVIPKIHIELGNEEWNFSTQGGILGLNMPGYGIIAQGLFATMKAKSDYVSSEMLLSVGSQFGLPGATLQPIQDNVSNNDEIVVGPYMYNSPYDFSTTNNIWQPLMSEPYVYWAGSIPSAPVCAEQTGSYPNLCPSQAYLNTNPGCTGTSCAYANYLGGGMSLNVTAESLTTSPKPLAIYEQNLGSGQSPSPTGEPAYTQADMYLVAPSLGAGVSYAEEILLNMQNGIKTQNTYQLAQPYFGTYYGGVYSPLWGIVNSMGGLSDTQRPQYLAQQMINSAIYPTMLTTSQTANPTPTPTINVGSPNSVATSATTVNTVAMNNVPTLQSFAFTDGSGHYSLIIINSDVSNAASVNYGGTTPSGTITQTILNSTNISDNNESSSVIVPAVTTISTPPSSIPAHSLVTLTWGGGGGSPAVTLTPTSLSFPSTNVGVSSSPMTITLQNTGTASLTVSAISITGANAGDFSETVTSGTCSTLPATVAVSGTCVFSVTFTPTATGSRSASLSITDNASGSPHTAGLSGTGTSGGPVTYYVSATGSDSNSGTSSSSPWQTIAKVNATTLVAGDQILFNAGNTFTGQLNIAVPGTSVNPIIVGSYGTGGLPVINATSNNFGIYVTTPNYVTISGLKVENATQFCVYALASASFSNYTVQNTTATGCGSNGIYTLVSSGTGTNIKYSSDLAYLNGGSGLKISGYGGTWNTATVTNNTTYQNSQTPSTSGPDNVSIGEIYLVCPLTQSCGSGTLVQSNVVYNGAVGASAPVGTIPADSYGLGIWADTLTGVTIQFNLSHDNQGGIGLQLEKTVNSVAYMNLVYNAPYSGSDFVGVCTISAGNGFKSTNNAFIQNTCAGTGKSALALNFESAVSGTDGMSGNTVQDNILAATSGYQFLASAQVNQTGYYTSLNVLNYNSFGVAASNFMYYGGTAYSTYPTFEVAWGVAVGGTNSLQSNPLLVGSGNYNLQATSPARAYGQPYYGYPASCGASLVDLGALPYPALCPSAPTVVEGQNITVGSTYPATISLSGTGTCTGCSTSPSTSVTYQAPSSVIPQHVMSGCQVLPNDNIFNTRIDGLPVDSRSATWITNSNSTGLSLQPSWGISYANTSTGIRNFKSYYGEYVNNNFPWPTYNDMHREGGNFLGSTGYGAPDHHVMIVHQPDCQIYETYNDQLNGNTVTCQDGVTTGCNVSSAVTYPSWSNYAFLTGGGVDAAGLPLAGLVPTLSEVKAGIIKHAVRFTAGKFYIQGNPTTGTPLLWPASLSNGCYAYVGTSGLACYNVSGVAYFPPIIGARARLKSTFNISTFSATAQIFLLALQNYGMVLADIGTSNAITTTDDLTQDATVVSAINEIGAAGISITNFDFVDESSLETSATSYQVCPINTTCAGAQNTYETPLNQAIITATPMLPVNSALSTPIALQGVTVGSKYGPDVLVQAGSYSWTIPTWVNGTTNQTVNWTLVSGAGSITTSGVYTPPTTTGGTGTTLSAVINGTSAADSTATIMMYLTILPTGTIRIDTGSASNTFDGTNTWLGAIQPEGFGALYNDTYPGWTGSNINNYQYETGVYGYGNDLVYRDIIVPNGNYDVSFLLGLNSQCGQVPCGSYPQCGASACNGTSAPKGLSSVYTYGPINLESQSQLGYNTYDWLKTVGYVSATPTPIATIPAKVTNNVLYAAVRGISNDIAPLLAPGYDPGNNGLQKAEYLGGISIATDAGSPHWTISTQQQNTIANAQTLNPFLVIDWFTGVNDPTWSIVVAPPGVTINASTGVLSASAITLLAGQPVTVKASDGTYSATATIYTAGSSYLLNVHP